MHIESPRFNKYLYSGAKAENLIRGLITHGGAFACEVNGELVGMIGGVLTEFFFSEATFACDLVLYVKPAYRTGRVAMQLVREFEEWAFSKGAAEVTLGISTGVTPDSTIKLYEKLGYTIAGHSMLKRRP